MKKEFQKDMTPLDSGQRNAVKYILTISQQHIDRVERIMKRYGMYEKGFRLHMCLNPDLDCYTGGVDLRRIVTDGKGEFTEEVSTFRGFNFNDNKWQMSEHSTSREFIHLFDAEENGAGEEEIPFTEKPLPADGLWVGSADNGTYVGNGEWDVNDSLS